MVDKRGRLPWHWRTMTEVHSGDTVVHAAKGKVWAVSQVTQPAVEALRPVNPPDYPAQRRGWLVQVRVTKLAEPITIKDVPLALRTAAGQRIFTEQGRVRQAYLAPFEADWFDQFMREFRAQLPPAVDGQSTG
jgi:hypothetical protein